MATLSYTRRFEPGTDTSAPPLLLLHGTGGNEDDLLPLGRQLAPGSALLSPRGDVSENGMPRFFKRFAEGVFDLEDVARRTHALADFIAAAVLLRPMVVLEPAQLPSLAGKRILISSGLLDPIVPPDHPEKLATQFRRAGADVALKAHAASHGLAKTDFLEAAQFFRPS